MKMRMKEILVGKEQLCSFGVFYLVCVVCVWFFCGFGLVWFDFFFFFLNLDEVMKKFSYSGDIISELFLLLLLWANILFLGITSSLSSGSILVFT